VRGGEAGIWCWVSIDTVSMNAVLTESIGYITTIAVNVNFVHNVNDYNAW